MPVRLMIVDDHPDVRYLLRAAVEDAPEDVEVVAEAADAAGALELVASEVELDVLVLDALMPMTDGYEVAAEVRTRRPGLPIVLCTGVVDDVVRAAAEAVGIAECVPKDEFERIPAVVARLAAAGRTSAG